MKPNLRDFSLGTLAVLSTVLSLSLCFEAERERELINLGSKFADVNGDSKLDDSERLGIYRILNKEVPNPFDYLNSVELRRYIFEETKIVNR